MGVQPRPKNQQKNGVETSRKVAISAENGWFQVSSACQLSSGAVGLLGIDDGNIP